MSVKWQLAVTLAALILLSGTAPAASQTVTPGATATGDGGVAVSTPDATVRSSIAATTMETATTTRATNDPNVAADFPALSPADLTVVFPEEAPTNATPEAEEVAVSTTTTTAAAVEPTTAIFSEEEARTTPPTTTTTDNTITATTFPDEITTAPGITTDEPNFPTATPVATTSTADDDTATTTPETTSAFDEELNPPETTTTPRPTTAAPTNPSPPATHPSVLPFSIHTQAPVLETTKPVTAEPYPVPSSQPTEPPATEAPQQPVQPVQFFPRGTTFDLQGTSLTFRPDRVGGSEYTICKTTGGKSFPINTAGSTDLRLSDESVARISFNNFIFPFYGRAYTSAYVGSNGYISFGSSDDSITSGDLSEQHFDKPRISGLLSDLAPDSESEISWKETPGYVVITFKNVPQFDNPYHRNDFQIALASDGSIGIGFLKVLSFGARVVGLSSGTGRPAGLEQTDLSTVGGCPPSTPSYNPVYEPPRYTLNNGNMEQLYSWWKFWHSFFPQHSSAVGTNSRAPSDSQFFNNPNRNFYSSRNGIYYP